MKSTIKILILAFVAISSSVLLISCEDLSRQKARTIVFDRIKSDPTELNLTINFFHLNYGIDIFNRNREVLRKLSDAGYISIDIAPGYTSKEIMILHDKIEPYYFYDNSQVHLIFATVIDVEITGIFGDENNKTVEYTRIYAPTELDRVANYVENFRTNHTARLKKYDDGWR